MNEREQGSRRFFSLGGECKTKNRLEPGTIILEDVTKRFRKHTLSRKSYSSVKSDLIQRLGSPSKRDERMLTVLDGFSITLPPGSSLGVVGRNGSGKSTLLKLIAGIYRPDTGVVRASGRISALIELGAGFHPDFTGRENIYLSGIMYGLTRKQIDGLFDRIVGYAELEDFIDAPVRTYSSGMYMRLGFSVAIHTDPDILLVDEVLAVGDAAFVSRCKDTVSDFKRQGKTLVFVTHDLSSVAKWCDEAIWLDQGSVRERGAPRRVIDAYMACVEGMERCSLESFNQEQGVHQPDEGGEEDTGERRWGSREVEITSVQMLDARGNAGWLFHDDEAVTVEVGYRINSPVSDLVFGIGILRADGLDVHGANTAIDDIDAPLPASSETTLPLFGVFRYRIDRLGLLENTYYLDAAVHKKDGFPFDYHHRQYKFSVKSQHAYSGVLNPRHSWELAPGYRIQADEI
jgi:ABC-type polysaccharide/polyol phosphate transport system ATPase subunit